MYVAKYWRNKKLRYRMIRASEHKVRERDKAEVNTLDFPRAEEKRGRRVRAVS